MCLSLITSLKIKNLFILMNTVIDNREREIVKYFGEKYSWISYKNLDVGDIQIGDKIIIERKTL